MLLDMPDQETHRAYIRAVAAALGRAGVPVTEPSFPVEDGPDWEGYRQATLPVQAEAVAAVYGDQPVAVLWDEVRGWCIGWGGTHDVPKYERRILGPILPEPREVVAAVQAALAAVPEADQPGPWRNWDEHDEAFEGMLDAFTRAERTAMDNPTVHATPEWPVVIKGIRLGGDPAVVAAVEAAKAAAGEDFTMEDLERHAHPDWDRVQFEAYSRGPVSQGAQRVGLARLYGPDDSPVGKDTWAVAASWYGWLPGIYSSREAALLAYGYVLGHERGGLLEELRNRVNRREQRAIQPADLIAYAERRAGGEGAAHVHLPGDCQPGTITLCCRTGDGFKHVPVDRALWQGASDEERAGLLAEARRLAGDETAAVEVVDVPGLGDGS